MWLRLIEKLKHGEPCEVWLSDGRLSAWHPATVVTNGGSGYWEVKLGDGRSCSPYIEHVRLPDQRDAWPNSGRVRSLAQEARFAARYASEPDNWDAACHECGSMQCGCRR